jgi:hypothetical protein
MIMTISYGFKVATHYDVKPAGGAGKSNVSLLFAHNFFHLVWLHKRLCLPF